MTRTSKKRKRPVAAPKGTRKTKRTGAARTQRRAAIKARVCKQQHPLEGVAVQLKWKAGRWHACIFDRNEKPVETFDIGSSVSLVGLDRRCLHALLAVGALT